MDSTGLRQLDALVAGAMGLCPHVWHYIEREGVAYPSSTTNLVQCNVCGAVDTFWHPVGEIDCSNYTTDWSAAGQVVEWIGNQGKFYIELYNDASGYSLDLIPIRLEDETDFVCGDRAPTAPLAICLAFLQAVGAEVPSE